MLGKVIFCFKQKTSYEMRISDWSSDVCSSDLAEAYLRDDDRQRDGAVGRAFQRKAKAPEHHRRDRAEREAGDRRECGDGERVEQGLDKLVVAERLLIIFRREAAPDDVALAVVEAEDDEYDQRRVKEQHHRADPKDRKSTRLNSSH